ncbi:FAD-dependent monooxygenase [Nonomuraea sp. NPDC046802]|uniref:FAD-dependent monooxygenase n=1 Tax=Nonomuraea sp. NPDC046802 TaxID=3154919 RepID=UPI0033DBD550
MTDPDVIVVGAGPTGLMLATELAMRGITCRVLEQRAHESNLTRAFGVHARTLELLDMRDLAGPLLDQGIKVEEIRPTFGPTSIRLSMRHPESRYPFVLIVPQARTEALLAEHARDLGVEIVRGATVTGVRQDGSVTIEGPGGRRTERAQFVIGCDGAHSQVRQSLGVGFSGATYSTNILLADLRLADPDERAVRTFVGRDGVVLMPPFGDGWVRAVVWDRRRENVPLDEPLGIEEVGESLSRLAGRDLGVREMRWSTRFRSERRQADAYRKGRVFLAGDAAHIHSPLGALGMNTGLQDAMNLGWKLAAPCRATRRPGYWTPTKASATRSEHRRCASPTCSSASAWPPPRYGPSGPSSPEECSPYPRSTPRCVGASLACPLPTRPATRTTLTRGRAAASPTPA